MEENSIFQDLWGGNEKVYSAIIAQTMSLFSPFDEFVKKKCNIPSTSQITSIVTEEVLSSKDQIDIFIQYDEPSAGKNKGYILGIENKKWAELQPKQLVRYAESLQRRARETGMEWRLLFLAPSRYRLLPVDIPELGKLESEGLPLIRINYQELIDILKKYTPLSAPPSFEKKYCEQLISFMGVLEIMPITQQELDSIAYMSLIDSLTMKTRNILNDIRDPSKDGRIEEFQNKYRLFSRMIGKFPIYIGFRFSADWYCNEPLLDSKPECIVYIKDVWDDEDDSYNKKLDNVYAEMTKAAPGLGICSEIKLIARKKQNECRLMIRRSMSELVNLDIAKATQWYKDVLKLLEAKLLETEAEEVN